MAVYKEGKGWAARSRSSLDNLYKASFRTKKEAQAWLDGEKGDAEVLGKPAGLGPHATLLGQALADYVALVVPYKKSGDQIARRLNRYVRLAGIEPAKVSAVARRPRREQMEGGADRQTVYFVVTPVSALAPVQSRRIIPKGLAGHRQKQATRSEKCDQLRSRLANKAVSAITPHEIQLLMNAMRDAGYAAQTVVHEQAVLREFFRYARKQWHWGKPAQNPAQGLTMPQIDNARTRIMSPDEMDRLQIALKAARNKFLAPCVGLLLETAMRKSEMLLTACWGDIDWERRVLTLYDAKWGGREVPLTQNAIAILRSLEMREAQDTIFPLTIEALNGAWRRAVKRAGLENLLIHDLRHCATTAFAKRLKGDIFLLQLITGHKTLSQLRRYVNLNADDVVQAMDATEPEPAAGVANRAAPDLSTSVAGRAASPSPAYTASADSSAYDPNAMPTNVVPFARRRAA
jgi:integrase